MSPPSDPPLFAREPVSPTRELGAYEALWTLKGQSFKALATMFQTRDGDLPSYHVHADVAEARGREVQDILQARQVTDVGFVVHGTLDYPAALRDARHPVQCLYYRGDLGLLSATRRVALVGSRQASAEGLRRARRLARLLVRDGVVVVSGLARGIDTAAHTAAIESGGRTIAVIGTPITACYPRENAVLQECIAREHLLVSQVPVIRHGQQSVDSNRLFFPERNRTMSALCQATVIVEASETSGSLIQAQAALEQGRRLFILDSCFARGLRWPEQLLARGAMRIADYGDLKAQLELPADPD